METPGDASELARALRRARLCTLGLLAVCALVIALRPSVPEPAPERIYVALAIAAGLGTILCRRFSMSPVISPRSALRLSLVSLVCASALGLVGVLVAVDGGAKQSGLLYTLVAALFSLRGLVRVPGRESTSNSDSAP